MNDQTPARHLALARKAMDGFAFEGDPAVNRFWDDQHVNAVDILQAGDCPAKGITSFSTIGLTDYPLIKEGKEFPVRVEFLAACDSRHSGFANALATAAFCVINSKWFCAPGIVFPDILAMYGLSPTMSDLYFVPPHFWSGSSFDSEMVDGKKTAWLAAVPVSRAESEFAKERGPIELEKLLEKARIDVFDLHRESVIPV